MKKTSIIFLLFILIAQLKAQQAFFIEGKVVDKETKEPLSAYVLEETTGVGCSADGSGYFKLTFQSQKIPERLKLSIWLIGYKKKEIETQFGQFLIVELELEPFRAQEVVVTADSIVSDLKSLKTVTMSKMDVYITPGTAADPLYASQVLPGVNSLPDASSLLIRGGGPDEVGYFFDGIEIEHPFLSESLHEAYFSIFDNQIIENFTVSTSGFHPKYSDSLSGIMDLTAKDTIFKKEAGLGLSIFGLNSYLGWPLKNVGNFMASYNFSRSEMFSWMNNIKGEAFHNENAFGKFRLQLNKYNSLRLYGLFDKYQFTETDELGIVSKNKIVALSWTLMSAKNFISKLILSRTNNEVNLYFKPPSKIMTKDEAWQARFEATLDLGAHFLELGADSQLRRLKTNIFENHSDSYRVKGARKGFYFNDKLKITDRLFATLGARLFSLDLVPKRWSLAPRASLAFLLTKDDILRISLGKYQQLGDYFLLKRNSTLKPKTAYHLAMSYDRIKEKTELRITLYDKQYRNLLVYEDESAVSQNGYGYARGAEFFLKKKERKYEAIFVYNFLRSKRKENEARILANSPFEIPHSFTTIFNWKFERGSIGIRFSYASGRPFTPLLGREWDDESHTYQPIWGLPFSQRYPAYKRLDLSGTRSFNKFSKLIVVYFGLMNVLNNKNVLRYDYGDDYSLRREQYSIFGRTFYIGLYVPIL